MFANLLNFFTRIVAQVPPEAKFNALPIQINAPREQAIARMLGRLYNLYAVPNPSDDVLQAIASYKAGIENFGYVAPRNQLEVEALQVSTRGE